MRSLLLSGLLCLAALSPAQPFSAQDRLGKSYEEVAAMGHDKWVAFYCDPSRFGPEGRVGSEKIYAIALYHRNEKLVAKLPKSEQEFYKEVWLMFANIAKWAFTIADSLFPNAPELSLETATSSTQINETIYAMLNPSLIISHEVTRSQVLALHEEGYKVVRTAGEGSYAMREYPTLGRMVTGLDSRMAARGDVKRSLAMGFAAQMVKLAALKRS